MKSERRPQQYEVGVVTGGLVAQMTKECLRVFRTWRYARKIGAPTHRWYGVYRSGTEICIANVGPLPGAVERASIIAAALSQESANV